MWLSFTGFTSEEFYETLSSLAVKEAVGGDVVGVGLLSLNSVVPKD